MIEMLGLEDAQALFERLPPETRLFTLSPVYAAADSARDASLETIYLGYREGDSFWLHCAHRGRIPTGQLFDLQSPYGYGGPVANTDDREFLARVWADYANWCRQNRILAEFVRFHPLAANWRFYGGVIRNDRDTVAIQLDADNALMAGYQPRCRTAIRKAIAARIAARWRDLADNVPQFGDFYRKGMAAIGAKDFYSFGDDYFSTLAGISGVRLLTCELDGEWLAAGIFLRGAASLEYHLSAATDLGRKLSCTNLLLHSAAEWARTEGLTWLYLGGGTDRRTDNPLLFFKAGFSNCRFLFRVGFAIHDRDEYESLRSRHCGPVEPLPRILFYR